ncbi:MAG: bifunctional phosphopantothenoylcysteine decarboxylase/phosphopantothenate--cysteine ligase CoaBC [Candidatus Dadabacteria bacterium]|nr:MAG: bifunctional phosphopantothenoylcysteine decarboxylase/phosphopantothenate--cysteine ligase CoaBC [Candidatus Dadabacteria bacterium]
MAQRVERRKIVLGITGSIAAYKSAELARLFVSRGYPVKVAMTEAAREFISALTLEAITGNPVSTDFWSESAASGIGHIELADWADAVVVAPASADFIAKYRAGFAENQLLALLLATRAPVILAPAMNVNMYEHQRTQENLRELKERGVQIVDPEEGVLACGWNGRGRMASPWEVFYNVRRGLSEQDYAGKKVLITTGPTREAIDPVRFISNRSSGKMGVALAREAFRRGADVTLIHGQVPVKVPSAVRCLEVTSAEDMYQQVMRETYESELQPDIVIMAAAVADYRPKDVSHSKIKKLDESLSLALVRNKDILKELGARRADNPRPVLVGFAVETGEIDELIEEAREKLQRKNADMIVGNFAADAFDLDTNRVWLVDKHGKQSEVATTFKSRVANKILDRIRKL